MSGSRRFECIYLVYNLISNPTTLHLWKEFPDVQLNNYFENGIRVIDKNLISYSNPIAL